MAAWPLAARAQPGDRMRIVAVAAFVHVAVLVDPAVAVSAETILREVQEAARVVGLQIHVLNASTSNEIDAAFAALARNRPDALIVANNGFFSSRRVQIATLAARDRIPAAYSTRDGVVTFHSVDYFAHPKKSRRLRQKWKSRSSAFATVDTIAHAFKHVKAGNPASPDLRAAGVVAKRGAFSSGFSAGFPSSSISKSRAHQWVSISTF